MPHVAHVLRRRARAVSSLLAVLALAACSSEVAPGDSATGGPADLVARSAWCAEHGCRAETPFTVTASGVVNHPFSVPAGESALVEVQTRDTVLLGAGLMLWSAGHQAGPKTHASLASFARGIVGDCGGVAQHVEAQHDVPAAFVGAAPPVDCGPWSVRAGRLAGGFFVSVDRRPPAGSSRPTVLDSVDRDSVGRDSVGRDSVARDSGGRAATSAATP